MFLTQPARDIAAAVRKHVGPVLPDRVGVALSGGGDSMALLHVLHECLSGENVEILAATVDHGLRPESAAEAAQAAAAARRLGVPHELLKWEDKPGPGNLQDQARTARYRLLTDWAHRNSIPLLALGHTANDQAETVLMRLMRQSGVTGLAAMPVRRTTEGVTFLRPLLDVSRGELREYLTRRELPWIEDPSNRDARFERVRVRKALEVLEPLGLTAGALAAVARNMAKARDALNWYTFLAARELAHVDAGAVVLDQRQFRTLPDETGYRLLVRALQWVSGSAYPPRRDPAVAAAEAMRRGGGATLGGCRVITRTRQIWICREFQAVREETASPGTLWDGRWRLHGGDVNGLKVRALGRSGLAQCPDWRATGRPGPVLEATPALWQGDVLVSAPMAGLANGWSATLDGGSEDFFASLLSH